MIIFEQDIRSFSDDDTMNAKRLFNSLDSDLKRTIKNKDDESHRDLVKLLAALEENGITVIGATISLKESQISKIDESFKVEIGKGVKTSVLNIKMKSDFTDASTVKQVADWLITQNQTMMAVKDYNRKKYNVTVQQGLRIADDIASNYMAVWTKRENLVDAVNAANSEVDILNITW